MRTHKYCPRCYRQLKRTRLRELGYSFECVHCDEDFFRIEVLSTKMVKGITKNGNNKKDIRP